MDTQQIIANLEAERDRLDKAIAALKGSKLSNTRNGRRGPRLSEEALGGTEERRGLK